MKKLFVFLILSLFLMGNLIAQDSKFGIGGNIGTNYFIGDNKIERSQISPNLGIYSIYNYSPKLSFKLQAGYGQMKVDYNILVKTSMIPVELIGMYTINNSSKFLPFIHAGLGIMNFEINGSDRFYDGILIGGTGLKMPLSPKLSFLLTADFRYTTGDDFNLSNNGGMKDGYFSLQSGLTYNLSPSKKLEKKPDLKRTDIIADLLNTPTTETQAKPAESGDNLLATIQLRSRIQNIQDGLDKRNAEIEELRTLVKIKNQKISTYEAQIAAINKNQPKDFAISQQTEQRIETPRTASSQQYSVDQMYKNAKSSFDSRNYREAISQFTKLSNENSNHKLAGNFVYWIGESYYGLQNYSAAIEAFKNVTNYENSPKYDDALLMSGLSYLKLGDSSKAKEQFEELILKFPKSEYKDKAQRYIQSIQQQIIS